MKIGHESTQKQTRVKFSGKASPRCWIILRDILHQLQEGNLADHQSDSILFYLFINIKLMVIGVLKVCLVGRT